MPPTKDFLRMISEYIHQCAHDDDEEEEVRSLATATLYGVKRTAKAWER
jgi:hypothetical protein